MTVKVGDIIIAKKTDRYWGYVKGDTLRVKSIESQRVITAVNLTRPNLLGGELFGRAFLAKGEYKIITDQEGSYVYFLGIPIFKIKRRCE